MAAITYANGTEAAASPTAETEIKIWVSPSTADSADTVTVPTVTGKTLRVLSAREATTGDAVTATVSGSTITLDAAGGGTNTPYVVMYAWI